MTVFPNMGLTTPVRGPAGSGLWKDTLDDDLALIDAHDHTTGKGPRIPTAGISINADLTFSSLYAPINLHRLTFASIVALSSNNKSLFVGEDHELYYRSNTGTNIKITASNALNVAAFTGGLGGDYAATGALLDYDDATDTYRFRQELNTGVRQFAKIKCADIVLTEYDAAGDASVPGNSVTVKSPDALAANYSLTMPAALPGSTSLVQLDSSGVLTASNTITNAATFSTSITTPTVAGTPNFTGAVTMASTLGVTGLITATAGVTAAANQHVTVSGTGRFKHGTLARHIHISAFMVDGANGAFLTFNQAGYISGISSVCSVQAPVPLDVGKRILTYEQTYDVQGTGSGIQPFIKRINVATGAVSNVATGVNDSSGSGIETQLISSINHTIEVGFAYYFFVNITHANHRIYSAYITYDEP